MTEVDDRRAFSLAFLMQDFATRSWEMLKLPYHVVGIRYYQAIALGNHAAVECRMTRHRARRHSIFKSRDGCYQAFIGSKPAGEKAGKIEIGNVPWAAELEGRAKAIRHRAHDSRRDHIDWHRRQCHVQERSYRASRAQIIGPGLDEGHSRGNDLR